LTYVDTSMHRLLDYHRRRYWLVNGWSIRFRVFCDFFEAVKQACEREGELFEFDAEDVELEIEAEDGDEAKITE
jgi:hypothetical protein